MIRASSPKVHKLSITIGNKLVIIGKVIQTGEDYVECLNPESISQNI